MILWSSHSAKYDSEYDIVSLLVYVAGLRRSQLQVALESLSHNHLEPFVVSIVFLSKRVILKLG